jgi:hypothetical protein
MAFLTCIAALKARENQYPVEVVSGISPSRRGIALRVEGSPDRPHQGPLLRGKEVPERRKAGHEIEGFVERRSESIGADQRRFRPLRDTEHPLTEIEAHGHLFYERTKDFEHRPGAAAQIERPTGRVRTQIERRRPEDLVGSAKGGDVELGGEEVVAPLGRGQSLAGQLPERRAPGMKQVKSLLVGSV